MSKFIGMLTLAGAFLLTLSTVGAQDGEKKGKGKRGGGLFGGDPEAAFKKIDADGDGKVSKAEFMKLAEKAKDREKAEAFMTKIFESINKGEAFNLDQYKKYREDAAKKFKGKFKGKKKKDAGDA